MYRVAAPRGGRQLAAALASAPATTLAVTSPSDPVAAGGATRLTVSLTNHGVTPVSVGGNLGLAAPAGWTAGPGSGSGRRVLRRSDTDAASFTVVPPAPAQPIGSATFTGTAAYRDVTGPESAVATLGLSFVPRSALRSRWALRGSFFT